MQTRPSPTTSPAGPGELGSSAVEYVGLGALATLLVSGLASALDSGLGDRLGATVVRRLLEAITGG